MNSVDSYRFISRQSSPSLLLDIVIPAHNSAKTIRYTLESLRNQWAGSFGVLLVDDCSTDNTIDIACEFQHVLNIAIIYLLENSGGPATPRNIGISLSKATYIAFLDADDTFSPNKVCTLYSEIATSPCCDVFFHPLRLALSPEDLLDFVSNTHKLIGREPFGANLFEPIERFALYGNYIGNSSLVIRRESLIGVGFIDQSHELVALEDFELLLRLASTGNTFFFLNNIYGNYLVNPFSIQNPVRFSRGMHYLLTRSLYSSFILKFSFTRMLIYGYLSAIIGDSNFLQKEANIEWAAHFMLKLLNLALRLITVALVYIRRFARVFRRLLSLE